MSEYGWRGRTVKYSQMTTSIVIEKTDYNFLGVGGVGFEYRFSINEKPGGAATARYYEK